MQIFRRLRWQGLFALALSAMLLVTNLAAWAADSPQSSLQRLDIYIQQAITHTKVGNFSQAKTDFKTYNDQWFEIEDGVKATSRQAYQQIESSMGDIKFGFSTQPPQPELLPALEQLHQLNQQFIHGEIKPPQSPQSQPEKVSLQTLLKELDQAETAITNQNSTTAAQAIKTFKTDWLEVEGQVAAKSKQAYTSIENNMALAYGSLNANPADLATASQAIAALKQDLLPYASQQLRYTWLDATLILLREGLEALLVLVALLSFLNKSGNGDKSQWLWWWAGAGIAASVVVAVLIQSLFSNLAGGGVNREILEGGTGLFAAAMLFYVSYWLHSKSSLGTWQGYIRHKVTSALANNSVFSLALLAFLAVFREGGETVLFYIGIAPAISPSALVGGLALGGGLLVVIAILMLRIGLTLPLKPFFVITSLLIYYLGFKFIGAGIHSLQVADVLPASPAPFLPSWEGLGLYPTWETTLPQLAVLLVAIAILLRERQRAPKSAT